MQNYTGRISVVALPIGNDLDISNRAKVILEEADVIAAEDTRILKNLGQKLCINMKQLISHHTHNETESLDGIKNLLANGKHIALVSDAGTPNISDPGFKLLRFCFENQIQITALPGASALTCSLSLNPIGGTDHYFGAFLPSKQSDRIKKLNGLKNMAGICSKAVFFESPHRLLDCLADIKSCLGNPMLFVSRELTKTYESFYFDRTDRLIKHFQEIAAKGEFVISIDLTEVNSEVELNEQQIRQRIKELLKLGLSSKDVQKQLLDQSKLGKKEVYALIQEEKNKID
ncbi:MAG: 16S rRNA (cytidine(1402)-2'-O)-methyltransferase [Bdellovibrionota bacterium]|nr:16S rRNA (cytidine(1402)-2'-O)-methyltransferase [Bdellovibrionota bacterium]